MHGVRGTAREASSAADGGLDHRSPDVIRTRLFLRAPTDGATPAGTAGLQRTRGKSFNLSFTLRLSGPAAGTAGPRGPSGPQADAGVVGCSEQRPRGGGL